MSFYFNQRNLHYQEKEKQSKNYENNNDFNQKIYKYVKSFEKIDKCPIAVQKNNFDFFCLKSIFNFPEKKDTP